MKHVCEESAIRGGERPDNTWVYTKEASVYVTCWMREVCVAVGMLMMANSSSFAAILELFSRNNAALASSLLPRRTSQ